MTTIISIAKIAKKIELMMLGIILDIILIRDYNNLLISLSCQ